MYSVAAGSRLRQPWGMSSVSNKNNTTTTSKLKAIMARSCSLQPLQSSVEYNNQKKNRKICRNETENIWKLCIFLLYSLKHTREHMPDIVLGENFVHKVVEGTMPSGIWPRWSFYLRLCGDNALFICSTTAVKLQKLINKVGL